MWDIRKQIQTPWSPNYSFSFFCGNLLRDWILRDGNSIRSDPLNPFGGRVIQTHSNRRSGTALAWAGMDLLATNQLTLLQGWLSLGPAPQGVGRKSLVMTYPGCLLNHGQCTSLHHREERKLTGWVCQIFVEAGQS